MRLGRLIGKLIEERGTDRSDLARALGITRSRLTHIVKDTAWPAHLVAKVLKYFDLSEEEALAEMSPEEVEAFNAIAVPEEQRVRLARVFLLLSPQQRQAFLASLPDRVRKAKQAPEQQ